MTKVGRIQRATVTLQEYYNYINLGYKIPYYRGKKVKVVFNCVRCGAKHQSNFLAMRKRNPEFIELCTRCAGSINTTRKNQSRTSDYYTNKIYRAKISVGVRRHYNKVGKKGIDKRIAARRENFIKNGIPDFSAKKLYVNNIACASFGEALFVQWKIKEGYQVKKCDFFILYKYKGKECPYIPDFVIVKNTEIILVEVKCDNRRNFIKKNQVIRHKNLTTYKRAQIQAKNKAARNFCKNKGWKFWFLTLDNVQFSRLYAQGIRDRMRENHK